ncbi:MAG: PorV/PorQ family protein, partial [Elusimicrobia bacterium]|nr:PorV/PorQ family protein [Candidatus Obscuribacterium magneticum]
MSPRFVIPAKAGIQEVNRILNVMFETWTPAFAGVTTIATVLNVLSTLFLLLSMVPVIHADDKGVRSAQFLTVPGDARGAALGEAFSAEAAGAKSLWYNPAGLSRWEEPSLSFMHALYVEDVSLSNVGYAQPLRGAQAVGWGATYLNTGSISSYDNTGQPADSYSPKDLCVRMAYAKTFSKTSVGVAGSYIKSTIQESASAFGFNVGLHQELGAISLALVGENYGGKLKFRETSESLPTRLRGGFSCRVLPGTLVSGDIVKPSEGEAWFAAGTEFLYSLPNAMAVSLRAGYNNRVSNEVSGLHGFAAGMGFAVGKTELNYAWVPFGDLEQTHRISLDFILASAAEARQMREAPEKVAFNPNLTLSNKISYMTGKKRIEAATLPVFPWKKSRMGRRTSQDRIMELLAKDALCTAQGPNALVTSTRGRARVSSIQFKNKKWVTAKAGQYLFQKDLIRTEGLALAHLIFANGTKAQILANTLMQIEESPMVCETCWVRLEQGGIYAQVEPNKEFKVITPVGEADLKGAQSQVSYSPEEFKMEVRTGSATFTSGGKAVEV